MAATKAAVATSATTSTAGTAACLVPSWEVPFSTSPRVCILCRSPTHILIHLAFIDNGGDGGSADGGNALLGGHGVGNGAHAVKGGPGGNAKGGDVNGPGGLLNIISSMLLCFFPIKYAHQIIDNAGDGGHANGGDAVLLGGLLGGKQRGDWGDKHDGPWGDRHDDGPNHD